MTDGRIKEKYNPTPTKRERAYHLWLMEGCPCSCGCGGPSTCVHHPLEEHPEQRWRRDHEYVVPMTDGCHRALHARGHERDAPFRGLADLAAGHRKNAIALGILRELKRAA